MLTKAQKRLMFRAKSPLTHQEAKHSIYKSKVAYFVKTLLLTDEQAKSHIRLLRQKSATLQEKHLVSTLNKVWPKSAKRCPNSPQKEKLSIPTIEGRAGDVIWTIDERQVIVECKQRGTPPHPYDSMVDKNSSTYMQSLHIVKGANTVYYALTEQDLKTLVADKVPPKLLQCKYQGMGDLTKLFKTTDYKVTTIDILALIQKEYPYIFFVRPRTYDLLCRRCTGDVLTNDTETMDNTVEMLKYCRDNYTRAGKRCNLANKLNTSQIELHMIETGEKSIELPMYRLLARLYATLMKPKKSKKSAKKQCNSEVAIP